MVEFLIDTGTQISVITKEAANVLEIIPSDRKNFTRTDGIIKECPTAKISIWPLGEKQFTKVEVLVGAAQLKLLGLDLLYGQTWKLPDGILWSFAMEGTGLLGIQIESERMWDDSGLEIFINSLGTSIPLLPSKFTNGKQYPLPTAALMRIDKLVTDLEKKEASLQGLICFIIHWCGQ